MRTPPSVLVAVALLAAVHSVSSATEDVECTYQFFSRTPTVTLTYDVANQFVVEMVGQNTLIKCQKKCIESLDCIAYYFITATSKCYKAQKGSPTPTTAGTDPSGLKQLQCYNSLHTFKCALDQIEDGATTPGTTFTATGYQMGTTRTVGACGSQCVRNLLCRAFHHSATDYKCYISMSLSTTDVTASTTSSMVSYKHGHVDKPNTNCIASTTLVPTGALPVVGTCTLKWATQTSVQYTDILKDKKVAAQATEAACQTQCAGDKLCTGYNYSPTTQDCWLIPDMRRTPTASNLMNYGRRQYVCPRINPTTKDPEECTLTYWGGFGPYRIELDQYSLAAPTTVNLNTILSAAMATSNFGFVFDTKDQKSTTLLPMVTTSSYGTNQADPFHPDLITILPPEMVVFKLDNAGTAGASSCPVKQPGCTVEFRTIVQRKFNKVGSALPATTLAACKAACVADATCVGVHFGGTTCAPAAGVGELLPTLQDIVDTGFNIYIKQQRCGSCMYQKVAGRTGKTARTAQASYNSEGACLNGCYMNKATCKAVQWDTTTSTCHFFATKESYTALDVTTASAAFMYYFESLCSVCADTYTAGTYTGYVIAPADCSGTDLQVIDYAVASEAVCKAACESNTMCYAAWYDSSVATKCQLCTKYFALPTKDSLRPNSNIYIRSFKCFSACTYTNYPNAAGPTAGRVDAKKGNPDDCRLTCDDSATCTGVTFDTSTTTCYTYTTAIGTPATSPNYVTYVKSPAGCSACSLTFEATANSGQTSTTAMATPTSTYTLEECQLKCRRDGTCVAVDFTANVDICSMYSSLGALLGNTQTTNYRKKWKCGECSFTTYPGKFGKGVATTQSTQTIDSTRKCLDACATSGACKGAAFSAKSRACQFYALDDVQNLPSNVDYVYYSAGICKACTPEYTAAVTNQFMSLSGVTAMSVTSEAACRLKCDAESKCVAIAYIALTQQCYVFTARTPIIISNSGQVFREKIMKCQGGCRFKVHPSVKPPASATARVQAGVATAIACLGGCEKDEACKSASFSTTNVCNFYDADFSTSLTADTTVNYYTADACKLCKNVYSIKAGVQYTGVSLGSQTSSDATLCQSFCSADSACAAAQFQTSTNVCNKFGSQAASLTANSDFTYYSKTKVCTAQCPYVVHPNRDAPKTVTGAVQSAVPDLNTCLAQCSASPTCKSFVFNSKFTTCTFYTANVQVSLLPISPEAVFMTSGACKECVASQVLVPGRTMLGGDSLGAVPQATCFSRCMLSSTCIAATSKNDGSTCWHHSKRESVQQITAWTVMEKTKKCGECRLYPYPGKKVSGTFTSVAKSSVRTKDECLAGCAKDPKCLSMLYKSNAVAPATACFYLPADHRTSLAADANYFYYDGSACKECTRKYRMMTNRQLTSGVSENKLVSDAAACGRECGLASMCFGYEWSSLQKRCRIFSDLGTKATAIVQGFNFYELYRDCSGCSLIPYPKRSSTGGVTKPTYKSEFDCIRSCQKDVACFGCGFNSKTSSCDHFFTDVSRSLTVNADVTFWSALDCRICKLEYKLKSNYKQAKPGTAVPGVTSLTACQKACNAQPTCVGVDFFRSNGACYWFTDTAAALQQDSNVDQYKRTRNCGGCTFTPYSQRVGKGGVAQAGTSSAVECLDMCRKASTCKAASHNAQARTCMFYTRDEISALAADTQSTYWSAGICKECIMSFKVTVNAARTGGVQNSVTSLDQCKTLCKINNLCAAFDYDKTNHRICYLHMTRKNPIKQGTTFDSYEKVLDCDGCNFEVYPQRVRTGGVQNKAFTSIVSCAAGCQKDSACQAISYNILGNTCQFYTTSDTASLTGDTNTVYWTSGQCKVCNAAYKQTQGVYMSAYTTSMSTTTVAACKKVCTDNPKCVGADVYLRNAPMSIGCYLSEGSTSTNTATDSASWVNFAKNVDCGDCKFSPTPLKGGSGGRPQAGMDTEKKCISTCATDAKCQAADYNSATKACNLYDTLSQTLQSKPDTYYWKTTGCKACQGSFFEYKNRVMTSSYKSMISTDIKLCNAECLATNVCVAFTFSTSLRQCRFFNNPREQDTPNRNVNDVISLYKRVLKCEGNCVYNRFPDFMAPGGQLQSGLTSIPSCLASCTKTETCISVSFKASKCYFHSMDATPTILSNRGAYFFAGVDCKKCVVEYAVSSSSRVASAASVPYTTEASCRAYCTSDRNCVSVDFDVVSNQCFMNTNQAATRTPSTTRTNRWKSYKCGACQYYPWPNSKMSTGLVQTLPTLADCQRGCTDSVSCLSAQYDSRNSKCYFNINQFDQTKLQTDNNYVAYEPRNCKECRYTMVKYPSLLWGSGSRLGSAINTEPLCQQACMTDFNCVAVDFNLLQRQCYQHNGRGLDIAGQSNYNHFRKMVNCGGCQYTRTPDTQTRQTGLAKPAAKDTLACGKACKDDSSCQGGFLFNHVTKTCHTFTAFDTVQFTTNRDYDIWNYGKCKGCRERYIQSTKKTASGVSRSRTGSTQLSNCQADCDRQSTCVAFDFSPSGGCFLIDTYGGTLVTDSTVPSPFNHYDRVTDCEGCHYKRYLNKRGSGIRKSYNTFQTCLEACNMDTTCSSIDYNTIGNECYFLVNDPAGAALQSAPGFSHYSPTNCKHCPIGFPIKESNKIGTNRIPQSGVITVAACQLACQTDINCVGVGFNRGFNQCVKYLVTVTGVTTDATRNWDLYRKYRECAGCLYSPYPGQRVATGGGTINSATDMTQCLSNCQGDVRCQGVDFNPNTKTCTHYASIRTRELVSDSSVIHWSKTGCSADNCGISWQTISGKEANNLNSVSSGNTDTACQANCATQRTCVGFNFRNSRCYQFTDATVSVRDQVDTTVYKLQERCKATARGDCTFSYLGERQGTGTSTTVTASTLASCLKECVGVRGCVGVTYNLNTRACQLFTAASSVANTAPAMAHVSYKLKGCTQDVTTKSSSSGGTTTPGTKTCNPLWQEYKDSHVSQGVAQGLTADVNACRKLCMDNGKCIGVDTQAGTAQVQCWLHLVRLGGPNILTQRSTMAGVIFHYLKDRCPSAQSTTRLTTAKATPATFKTTAAQSGTTTQASSITNPPSCSNSWTPNLSRRTNGAQAQTGFTGGQTGTAAYVAGLAQCQRLCDANPKCVSVEVDRDPTHVFCWLQDNPNQPQIVAANIDSYRINRCTNSQSTATPTTPAPSCTPQWDTFPNQNSQGATYDTNPSLSLAQCRANCNARSSGKTRCVGVDYNTAGGTFKCWYHNAVNTRAPAASTVAYVLKSRCINGVASAP